MEKFKSLNIFQKSVLLILTTMVIIFTIIYVVASSKEGLLYRDKILVPHEDLHLVVITYARKFQTFILHVTCNSLGLSNHDSSSKNPSIYNLTSDCLLSILYLYSIIGMIASDTLEDLIAYAGREESTNKCKLITEINLDYHDA